MNKRDSWDKTGISGNDEPTRFLSEEEIEELERAAARSNKSGRDFNTEDDVFREPETSAEYAQAKPKPKVSKVKIEDIEPPEVKYKKPRNYKKFFKRLVLVICFIGAAILGFYLAFTWNHQDESDYNAKQHEVQQLEVKQKDLDKQQQELADKRDALEAEKQQLAKEREELTQEKSFIATIVDKVTGKDAEDKAKAEDLQDKINTAQSAIDDIGKQLNGVDDLKTQVKDLKSTAQSNLEEHRDTIDMIKYELRSFIDKALQ